MTKNFSHRIIAISLAFLLMFSSTGFSINIHFCQGNVRGISFLGESNCCSQMQASVPCKKENKKQKKGCQNKKENVSQSDIDNCCHNESLVVDSIDLDATNQKVTLNQAINFSINILVPQVALYTINFDREADFTPFPIYHPPLPDKNFQVFYQTFLI